MQLATETRPITTHGVRAEKRSSIRMGPHMFDLLSDLYSDLPLAIVRELVTNMLDGHTRRAKLHPGVAAPDPELHLPTRLAPVLILKDYGTGMDFDTVWNVFQDYGGTTKGDSNDEVGGFGIGAKAPHAYRKADQWTVESRFDGEKHIFNATRDAEGVPTLQHITTLKTDEPNGVTIKIPVPEEDWDKFYTAAAKVLRYFPIPITVTGLPQDYDVTPPVYAFQGAGWGIRGTPGRREWNVVMGNVAYPLDLNALGYDDALTVVRAAGTSGDLFFPVGSVSPTPSREALKYTDATKARILGALRSLVKELGEQASAQIADAPTLWDALVAFHTGMGVPAVRETVKKITWQGQELDVMEGLRVRHHDLVTADPTIKLFSEDGTGLHDQLAQYETWKTRWAATSKPEEFQQFFTRWFSPRWSGRVLVLDDLDIPLRKKDGQPVSDDLSPETVKRVRHFIRTERGWTPPRRRFRSGHFDRDGLATVIRSALDLDAVQALFGGHPIILASSLPEAPLPEKTKRSAVKSKVLCKQWNANRTEWTPVELDTSEEYPEGEEPYFVRLEGRNEPVDFRGSDSVFRAVVSNARVCGLLPMDAKIIGIPRSLKRVERTPGWRDLRATLAPKVKTLAKEILRQRRIDAGWAGIKNTPMVNFFKALGPQHFAAKPTSPAFKLVTALKEYEAISTDLKAADSLCRMFDIPVPEVTPDPKPAKLIAAVEKRHPVIALACEATHHSSYSLISNSDLRTKLLRFL